MQCHHPRNVSQKGLNEKWLSVKRYFSLHPCPHIFAPAMFLLLIFNFYAILIVDSSRWSFHPLFLRISSCNRVSICSRLDTVFRIEINE